MTRPAGRRLDRWLQLALAESEPPTDHPSVADLVDYQEGRLPADRHDSVAEHLARCRSCSDDVLELAACPGLGTGNPIPEADDPPAPGAGRSPAASAAGHGSAPARPAPPRRTVDTTPSWTLRAAAAVLLVAAGSLATWILAGGSIDPGGSTSATPVEVLVLHPESDTLRSRARRAAPAPSGATPVVLRLATPAVTLPEARAAVADGNLRALVVVGRATDDGAERLRLTLERERLGSWVELQVPAALLAAGGLELELSAAGARGERVPLATYRAPEPRPEAPRLDP